MYVDVHTPVRLDGVASSSTPRSSLEERDDRGNLDLERDL